MADAEQSAMKLALENITLGGNSSLPKSPTRSPVKAKRQLPALSIDTGRHLDVDDAPDSTHANDQHGQRFSPTKHQSFTKAPAQAESDRPTAGDDTSHKYIQLLNIASATGLIHGKSKLPSGASAAQPSAISSSTEAGAVDPAASRTSTVGSSVAAKVAPASRVPRTRASILDASSGPSLIPTSPATEKAPQVPSPDRPYHRSRTASNSISSSVIQGSPSRRPDWRTGAKSTDVGASPARCSLGASSAAAAAPRPQYAFGTRIDSAAAAARKPSPMRQSAPSPVRQHTSGTAADHSRASPQRVPAAAKTAAAATASLRSASAPRMAAADKAQSRFAQHQASGAAALRSKTPNPARARVASAVGPAGSSTAARFKSGGGVLSSSVASSAAQSKHIARMRASDVVPSRLPGGGSPSPVAARSASPASRVAAGRASVEGQPSPAALRGFARSLPTAAGAVGNRAAAVGSSGSPTKLKPVAPTGHRAAGPRAERVLASATEAGTNSKLASISTVGIPTLQDRYKTGYKHTPAALAVAEARAAVAAAKGESAAASTSSAASAAVPKLSLGSLLKSPATPGLLRTRQGEQGGSNIPSNVPGSLAAEHGISSSASPFLGRISAATPAGVTPGAAQKQHTPQLQQQLHRRSLPLQPEASGPASLALIPPSPAATPSAAPEPTMGGANCTASMVEVRASGTAAVDGERMSPPLLPRELSGASLAAAGSLPTEEVREFRRQSSSQVPCLTLEGSTASVDSASVAVAAKGLVQLPLHRLNEEVAAGQEASPPRHRRGERSSPKGAAAVCSQLLKSKASSICSGRKSAADAEAATPYAATLAPAGVTEAAAGISNCAAALEYATPVADSTSKTLSFSPGLQSSDTKLRGLVPRLDLTPVLAQAEEDQLEEQQQQEQDLQQPQREHHGLLLLEHSVQQEEQEHEVRSQTRPGAHEGKPASAAKRGVSAGRRPASGSSKRSATAAEPPPQESFYVYESVVPAEETRTYDELRRALLKCHNGHRLAANLQGIWGCYQDARRNTEAMAFRGHRLLDQVSNEYCAYKRDAEQQLTQLQQECDAYKEELQLALCGAQVGSRDGELTQKDKQVRELQHENQQLRLQMLEMEKALQKAADYHQAQQADQVPVKARAIAESATTSILFQQTVAQQEELLKSQKMLEDMKAALMIACGTLKQTNYMDPQGPVRAALQPDTIQVLDMMISSTQVEASMLDQAAAAAHIAQPQVEIEELQ